MSVKPLHNDLSVKTREAVVKHLNQHLADLSDLYSQTKQAHWNVKGPNFIQLHKLFDDLAATILEFVDVVAERATALGGVASGTTRMAAANSRLAEFPDGPVQGLKAVSLLVERYAAVGKTVRKGIDEADEYCDKDTADLYTQMSREIDKSVWFLEAHLQGES